MKKEALNFVGGIPDLIISSIPDVTIKKNAISKEEYLEQLAFYSDEKYPDNDGKFFTLPGVLFR